MSSLASVSGAPSNLGKANVCLIPCPKPEGLRTARRPSAIEPTWVGRIAGRQINYLRYAVHNSRPPAVDTATNCAFAKIIQNRAAELLSAIPHCSGDPMEKCGNFFDNMLECACLPLNRKFTTCRIDYENKVINAIYAKAKDTKVINLALFASGHLFSDLVLFVKLIKHLEANGWDGKLNANFIDQRYSSAKPIQAPRAESVIQGKIKALETIQKANLLMVIFSAVIAIALGIAFFKTENKALRFGSAILTAGSAVKGCLTFKTLQDTQDKINELQKESKSLKTRMVVSYPEMFGAKTRDTRASLSIPNFISYMQSVLPPSIQLKARFFSEASDYIALCQTKPKFNNDFLLGSDVDRTLDILQELNNKTQNPGGEKIILAKMGREEHGVTFEYPELTHTRAGTRGGAGA